MKCAIISTVHKKMTYSKRKTIDQSVDYHLHQKFMKELCTNRYYFFEPFFNEIMCGFWKAHSTQHAISKLLASLQKSLDEGGFVGSILMDLSKKKGRLPFKDPYWGP